MLAIFNGGVSILMIASTKLLERLVSKFVLNAPHTEAGGVAPAKSSQPRSQGAQHSGKKHLDNLRDTSLIKALSSPTVRGSFQVARQYGWASRRRTAISAAIYGVFYNSYGL